MFFPTAKALVNGAVTLADFTPEGLRQPEVVALGDRMSYAIDSGLAGAGVVEVALRDGRVLREQVSKPLGHPDNPLSGEALKRKFMDCGRHAPNGLSRAALERVVETVDQLETLTDVRQLVALLSNSSAAL
jgi:2-methylcitrate dehydratase PrpD